MENLSLYVLGLLFLLFIITNINQFKKSTGVRKVPRAFYVFLLAYIIFLPGVIVLFFMFALYRQLVKLILKIKHGSQFGGLLGDADVAHVAVKPTENVINILMICEYDEQRYQQGPLDTLRQAIHNFYFRDPDRFPKFVCSYRNFLGYTYMLKNQVTVDDCVREMHSDKANLDRKDVLELITEYGNSLLPKNETVFWEILVGTRPVKWDENNPGKTYPVLVRMQHSVADGVSLVKLMVGAFADNPTVEVVSPEAWKTQSNHSKLKQEKQKQKGKILDFCKLTWKALEFFLLSIYVLFLAPTTIYPQIFVKANDRNILQGDSVLSGQVLLAVNCEVGKKYVQKIKKIKGRLPGTAFSDILLAAFSAGLDEYFSRSSSGVSPKDITAIVPVASGSAELKNLRPGENIDLSLKNRFSMFLLTLPIRISPDGDFDGAAPMSGRLKRLQKETGAMRHSKEYMVNYFLLSEVLAHLPHFVNRLYVDVLHCTAAISVLPGPPKVTFCGGSPVHDVAFWVPNAGNIGVTLSAFTYDGRLQIGLNVDKNLISNINDAQNIVDGVYKYIDMLDEETA